MASVRQGRLTGNSLLHVCWRRLGTRQKKKKGDSVCGFIGVRWRRVGSPTKTKAKISPTFHAFTGLLRLNELSVDLGVQRRETRAADKLRTNDTQTVLLYKYRLFSVRKTLVSGWVGKS